MDTIREEWSSSKRIGGCVPLYNKEKMIEIEDYIIEKCMQYGLQCKYNVGVQVGGIPPREDKTPIVNPSIHAIRYHDMLGGMLISTRNAELNCRNIDRILYDGVIDNNLISSVLSNLSDKYSLEKVNETFDKVLFFPGSNISHVVDNDRVDEILFDNPNAIIKPHPIQTEEGLKRLKERYEEHLLDSNVSGVTLLNNCSVLWTTANSEMGLMAALLKKPFGDITIWRFYYELLFAPFYRRFKYKRVEENFDVITKILSSKISGYVAPWMDDWPERVDIYFEFIFKTRKTGDIYPYIN